MLNFKKGLALVLAAATAFTFAPVANLGVTANAATSTVTETLTVPAGAYTTDGVNTAVTATNTTLGYTAIQQAVTADGMQIKGLTASTKTNVSGDNWFKIASINGEVDSDSNIATAGVQTTSGVGNYYTTKNSAADKVMAVNKLVKATNGTIQLGDIYLHAGGTHTITLVDLGPNADGTTTDGENLVLTINADQNKQTTPTAHVYTTTVSGGNAYYTKADLSNKNDSAITAGAELNPQTSTYFLELNKYNPGYVLSFAVAGSSMNYTNWAGSQVTVTKAELTNANRSIQWANKEAYTATGYGDWTYSTSPKAVLNPSAGNSFTDIASSLAAWSNTKVSVNSTDGSTVVSGLNGTVFKTTAATAGTDKIDVTFTGNNGGSASTSVQFSTERSEAAIDSLSSSVGTITKTATNYYTLTGLNTQIVNSGKLTVKSESGDVRFISVDPSIFTIDEKTGEFKVLKKGETDVHVYVGGTTNNKAIAATIHVTVSPWATDSINITTDANVEYYTLSGINYLDLDVPTQTAANAVREAKLNAVSAGKLATKWEVLTGKDVVSVDQTGLVKALKAGTATIQVSTSNDVAKEIWGATKTIRVTVWTLPAAVFTVDPITVNVNESTLVTPKVTSPANYSYTVNYVYNTNGSKPDVYDLTNPGVTQNNTNLNTQTTSRLTGKTIGTSSVYVTVLGTSANRPTTKTVGVSVLDKNVVNTITLDAGSQSLVLKEGDTAQLKATSSKGKAVTFEGGNADVATVSTSGAVVAVKAGQTAVTAKSEGAADVVIPVVVVAKEKVYATPAKVTGVKVTNKKGAKVTVKFAKDKTNSTMKYYVQKKVSGKTSGKSIGSTKTTLSVKKGATIKVRVKAYYTDANGVKHVGAYSSWKTLKTDKK